MRKTYTNYTVQHKYKVLRVILSYCFRYKIKIRDKNLDNFRSLKIYEKRVRVNKKT